MAWKPTEEQLANARRLIAEEKAAKKKPKTIKKRRKKRRRRPKKKPPVPFSPRWWAKHKEQIDKGVMLYVKVAKGGYQKYMTSPEWVIRREWLKDRLQHECSECGTAENLHVHHLHYRTLGHESERDVEVLCEDCHRKEHAKG